MSSIDKQIEEFDRLVPWVTSELIVRFLTLINPIQIWCLGKAITETQTSARQKEQRIGHLQRFV